jgi:signal transduction histidine kinase
LLSLAILIAEREKLRDREAGFNSRLLQAQDRERARVAQELHDDIAQRIALLQIGLKQFRQTAALSTDARTQVDGLTHVTSQISSGIRTLSRDLHPSALDVVGLKAAITGLCRELAERNQLKVQFICGDLPEHLERAVSLCLFRIVQEALHNVVKHSGVDSAVVELSHTGGGLQLSISDAGTGFDLSTVDGRAGLGLISMRERLRPFGGTFSIRSTPRAGTHIRVSVPVNARASQLPPTESRAPA